MQNGALMNKAVNSRQTGFIQIDWFKRREIYANNNYEFKIVNSLVVNITLHRNNKIRLKLYLHQGYCAIICRS